MPDRDKKSSRATAGDSDMSRPDSARDEGRTARDAGTEDDGVDDQDIPRATDSRPRGKTEDPDRTL